MRAEDRQPLRARYRFSCGYCGVHETDVGAELTVDHYQPRAQGGTDAPDNLVHCCHACNEFKGDYWHEGADLRLLHPLQDDIPKHFVEKQDGSLHALTPRGELHIRRLRLNRVELVAYRVGARRRADALAEQQELLRRMAELEQRIEALQSQIATLAPHPKAGEQERG